MPKLISELGAEVKKLATELEAAVKKLFGETHDMTLEQSENTAALHDAVDDHVQASTEAGETHVAEEPETTTGDASAKTTAQGGTDVAAEDKIQGNGAEPAGDLKD